jgi:hypothetical protein
MILARIVDRSGGVATPPASHPEGMVGLHPTLLNSTRNRGRHHGFWPRREREDDFGQDRRPVGWGGTQRQLL